MSIRESSGAARASSSLQRVNPLTHRPAVINYLSAEEDEQRIKKRINMISIAIALVATAGMVAGYLQFFQ